MAPAKKQAHQKPKAAKQSNDCVAKRPARGFHRFKNGMLNVTPKGGERELQDFHLLHKWGFVTDVL
jgi:hypothetical protein